MATPSFSRPSPLPRSPLFTPISELDRKSEVDDVEPEGKREWNHHPTPLPKKSPAPKDDRQLSVFFNKCRPSSRDKSTTVVPLDNGVGSSPVNPKTLLHSLLLALTRKSPRPAPASASASTPAAGATAIAGPSDGEWKFAAQELSKKLLNATRRRDEALLEASRLKNSVADLERKLDRLESYCLDLKSALDRAVAGPRPARSTLLPAEQFLAAVVDARTAVRALTRALSVHIRPSRITSLLKLPIQSTGVLLVYMEALLNQLFYEEFEKLTEEETKILDPTVRAETNKAVYEAVRGLTWEEVLSKGTKHYSEGLSKFCDKKMSDIVGMMGCARAWPESLLQAFFGASKGVWIVYLLSRCFHPSVPILRVERGVGFDGKYLEDVVVGERGRRGALTPVSVRMMVAPGFYLYSGECRVVKCKVVCGYNSESESSKLKVEM